MVLKQWETFFGVSFYFCIRFKKHNMMANPTFILTVALAAAFILLVVGLVAVIIYYRCRLKDSHRTLVRFIEENILLREGRGDEKGIDKYEGRNQ